MRLLVLDIDGTLTDSGHEVPAVARAAVARVVAAGVRVMIATGRRYRDALPIARALGVDVPLVSASGALVKRPSDHATLSRAAFAPGVLEGVVRLIVERGYEPILYSDSYARGFDFHCRSLADIADDPAAYGGGLREYLGRNRGLADVVHDLHESPPEGVFAGFVMGPHAAMNSLEADLDAAFPGSLSLHTIKSPRYRDWMCEIAPVGVTKWSGVCEVAAAWGIRPSEICAVGDDVNDLAVRGRVSLLLATADAAEPLRRQADLVLQRAGGNGAVRELAERLLRFTPLWQEIESQGWRERNG